MSLKRALVIFCLSIALILIRPYFIGTSKLYASGDVLTTPWQSGTNLPHQLASHGLVGFNNKLYVIGGANSSDYSDVISTDQNADGTVTFWQNTAALPQTRYWASTLNHLGKIYVLGGASVGVSGQYLDTVLIGDIDSQGNVASWSATASLPEKSGLGAAVVVGNSIYFAGGLNGSGAIKNIYKADINSDGSLSAWSSAGQLPLSQYGFGLVEDNGHLIEVGGYTAGNQVYTTTLDASGNVSSWQQTASLPTGVYRASVLKIGSQIYSLGGSDQNTNSPHPYLSVVYYADINSDGTINAWSTSANPLPAPVESGATTILNNYLYLTGGYSSSSGYLNSVYYTQLTSLPTPTPTPPTLNVPSMKQTDPFWGSQTYDSANQWFPSDPTISRWGCALTSAAMILQYNGITMMPNGTSVTPGNLNTWLKSQTDGYVSQGWVNWLALFRLSKLAKAQNPSFAYDALEYGRKKGFDSQLITSDLTNNVPVILEEPGHFIVATGVNGSTFSINDPYYPKTLLADYSNTALSMGTFIPAHSDGSYLQLIANDGVKITVQDSGGNTVGEGFTQQPLSADGIAGNSGDPKYFYLVPKPSTGNYTITISSNTNKQYTLQTYLYDKNGIAKIDTWNGLIGYNYNDTFTLSFVNDSAFSSFITQTYSFDQLLADLDISYQQGWIKSILVYKSLRLEVEQAKKFAPTNKKTAKMFLQAFIGEIKLAGSKIVLPAAQNILLPEANYLISTL